MNGTARFVLAVLWTAGVVLAFARCEHVGSRPDEGDRVGSDAGERDAPEHSEAECADGGGDVGSDVGWPGYAVGGPASDFIPVLLEVAEGSNHVLLEGWRLYFGGESHPGVSEAHLLRFDVDLARMEAIPSVLAEYPSFAAARAAGAFGEPDPAAGDAFPGVRFRDFDFVIPQEERFGIGVLRLPDSGERKRALFWFYDADFIFGEAGDAHVLDCDAACCVSHHFAFAWTYSGDPAETVIGWRGDAMNANGLRYNGWQRGSFQAQCAVREPRPLVEFDEFDACDFGVLLMTADFYCPCPAGPCAADDRDCITCPYENPEWDDNAGSGQKKR